MGRSKPWSVIPLGCLLAILLASSARLSGDDRFVRGDVDGRGSLNVADGVQILRVLFQGAGSEVTCLDAADIDNNGQIQIGDAVWLLNYLFARGRSPAPPFPGCGEDTHVDELTCAEYVPCRPKFFGLDLATADGVVFVTDRSGSMQNSGELQAVKSEIIRNLNLFSRDDQFGIVIFDAGVQKFPTTGKPADATPENVATATAWVTSIPGGGGSCILQGLVAAVLMANESAASEKVIIYAGDGGGTCAGQNEADYLERTLSTVATQNTQNVTIHTVGVLEFGEFQANFLRELAQQNGGVFIDKIQ